MDIGERLVTLLVGGLIGIPIALYVRYKFVRIDEVSSRFDDLCDTIQRAADAAAEYWCMNGADDRAKILEAKMRGHQIKIDLLINLLQEENWALRDLCEMEQDAFYDALTGGNFEVRNRLAEPPCAVDAQTAAAVFIIQLRSQRRTLLRLLS